SPRAISQPARSRWRYPIPIPPPFLVLQQNITAKYTILHEKEIGRIVLVLSEAVLVLVIEHPTNGTAITITRTSTSTNTTVGQAKAIFRLAPHPGVPPGQTGDE
ncbi:MAG: hypothetical protein K6U03_03905, partial [Firmicutes bacterium]|nr:hypothetical protein [Bacillota bacterium]